MVLLAASICTRGGKPVISRQFRDMPRSRVEGLLSSFPKLLPANSQHTTIETDSVRYVYQPLEDLYMILITNRSSNILQDIDTLHLFARTVSDLCRSLDERDIVRNSFELLEAFDEIVSLGYRENVSLTQIRSILEMDSHEEKIQEIIERNKEMEAKEELKRRAKQLELQRREAARRGMGPPGGGFGSGMGMGGGGSGGAYSSVPGSAFEPAAAPVYVHREGPSGASGAGTTPAAKPFKGKGMQLGKKTKGDLLGSIDG
ncbi:coatomer subunit delta [Tilletia horrida]|uniref:Coatomer subunit delta n=1 Tax=Tilletia horrida TaxID=155126 RepID=A0AAN6JMB4_9BASI|nr:coatomer subunit delta [Tilletia horrida]KAK0536686.1 coatomer subunit delta [Tilletia horrida]KAK0539224.1 coatomer subunit delta [Tilletia horrida]